MMKSQSILVFILMATINFGCETNPSDSDTNNPEGIPESTLDCESEGYPCSLSDVPDEIYQETYSALQQASEIRDSGTMEDVREYFESLANIEEVVGDETALRFRLNGGTPAWFLDVTGSNPSDKMSKRTPADKLSGFDYSVVGEDQNGDDKVNNRDDKRALVLAPYYWDFSPYDETPVIADRLNFIEEYEGNVVYKSNPDSVDQNISTVDYMSWDQYDTIFVSTHGQRTCWRISNVADKKCGVVISSGVRIPINIEQRDRPTRTGAYLGWIHNEKYKKQTNAEMQLMLTQDFFQTVYPDGLDNAIVIFSACETGASGASELAEAIGGENFVLMGWTEIVPSLAAASAANQFLFGLENGLPAEAALEKVEEAGLTPFTYNDDGKAIITALAHYAPFGGDERLVELPELLKDGKRVIDGTDLSEGLEGSAGDGEPDVLNVATRVNGIVEGKEQNYQVRYFLDDQEASEGYGLVESERIDEYTVIVNHKVELGFDAPKEAELEVVVDLPEGGESRYAAEVNLAATCGWQMTVSGAEIAGSYDSNFTGAQLGPVPTIFMNPETGSSTGFRGGTIQLVHPLPEDVPTTMTLGLTGDDDSTDDGFLTLNFNDVIYRSGNGEPCCTPNNPVDTYTPALEFDLDVNEPNEISGKVSGEVWADAKPGETLLRKATVDIDFTVINNGQCVISDPQNPL